MLYSIALTMLPGLSQTQALAMIRQTGNAENILLHPEEALHEMNGQLKGHFIKLVENGRDEALKRAKEELSYCQHHGIQVIPITSPNYPERLSDCPDAPVVLYYRGTDVLNSRHTLAIVGTRRITEYGKKMCAELVAELAAQLPDLLIVSGLAYGVDIHAQRACLKYNLPTIGVVAHGMDQIYPAIHRNDAIAMTNHGGILTEYKRGTQPLQGNFLRRNRIIAGLTDATLVVESAEHGGSLVTAKLAGEYNRNVFAVPGRITDRYSIGCNNLILRQAAYMVTSAKDIIDEMGWTRDTVQYNSTPHQLNLFDDGEWNDTSTSPSATHSHTTHTANNTENAGGDVLSPEEQKVYHALKDKDGLSVQEISFFTEIDMEALTSILFNMELEERVVALPGGRFRLM